MVPLLLSYAYSRWPEVYVAMQFAPVNQAMKARKILFKLAGYHPGLFKQVTRFFSFDFFSKGLCLVHQFGLFEFKTGKNSLPSTPTHRSKASIFGLDAISRNLFNRPGSSMGDFFGGSINGHRRHRSRSTTSRSSTYTQTTTTADSMKSSHRSNSTTTAATTMSTMDDDSSFFASRSSKEKKLSKRSKSLVDPMSDSERGSPNHSLPRSRSQSRSSSRGPDPDFSDIEDNNNVALTKAKEIGSSDYNLAVQLELARQNSLNQHGKRVVPMPLEAPVEATIYEGEI